MALTSYNDARETLRQTYSGVFETLYAIRRQVHFFVLGLAAVMVAAPGLWWLWLPLMLFLYTIDADRQLRMQDRFGRGRGPYLKKKAGLTYGQIEEWSVISTPRHRGGDGIWPLGNNMHTQEEIWCSDEYVRAHAVLSGTTGSGKTVTMSSTFIFVAMVSDSGVIMIDGKADPKTWFDLYAMAVAAGRADDFLVLNFVVGATQEAEFAFSSSSEKELWEEFQSIESNTFNIFGTGTADTLFEIGSGLLGDEASGDNKMWVERAQALLRSMLKALTDLRDLGQLKISIATLQEYMSLEKLSELENNPDISQIARQQVGAVLNEIAGYRDAMKVEDPQRRAALLADQPSKQFAFLHMQFGALYAMLIGTYGHISNVEYSDIYTPDVIRSRRILLVMLPALEKAPTSLAQLGRMATSAIKSALAQNISGALTGRKAELVDRRPTNSMRAMVLIYDEAASYIQAGTADVASQSRSLGAFNIFSSQEWSSFKQAGEIEATRLISNSGLKIVLKNEDKETAEHFMNAVGDAQVLKSGGKRWEKGRLVETERRLDNVPRVTFQEMMNLAEGQAFIKWRDTMILARMPYVPVKPVTKAQRNDLVPIPGSMANDRARIRKQKSIARNVEQTKLPPLNLIEGLLSCKADEENPESAAIYPLFELITRILYKKQVIIPWESAPPPRGKVEVRRLYKFKAETMAEDLMWALERTSDDRLMALKTLPEAPESRFVIPFLPHEEGLIDPAFKEQASILEIAEETDKAVRSAAEAIAEQLEAQLAKLGLSQDSPTPASGSMESGMPAAAQSEGNVDSNDHDSGDDEENYQAAIAAIDELAEVELDEDDELASLNPDSNPPVDEAVDLSAFMPELFADSLAQSNESTVADGPDGYSPSEAAIEEQPLDDDVVEVEPEVVEEEDNDLELAMDLPQAILEGDATLSSIDEPQAAGPDTTNVDDSRSFLAHPTTSATELIPESPFVEEELCDNGAASSQEAPGRDPLMEAILNQGITLTPSGATEEKASPVQTETELEGHGLSLRNRAQPITTARVSAKASNAEIQAVKVHEAETGLQDLPASAASTANPLKRRQSAMVGELKPRQGLPVKRTDSNQEDADLP